MGPTPRRLTWLARLRLNRCGVLLAGLCAYSLTHPLTNSGEISRTLANVALLGLLLMALWALDPDRRIGVPAWAFTAAILGLYAGFFLGSRTAGMLLPYAYAALEAAVTASLLSFVLNPRRVTVDKIFGAIAVYLLMAMLFASLFGLVLRLQPGALVVAADPQQTITWFRLYYFAINVLTSSGLADLAVASDMMRALVLLAQVAGTMYVAFLVARLANLFPRKG